MSSTKKKVIISLSSLVAVILIAACAFVAVFAARNATVTSKFSVSYTANHVLATITGKYQVKGDASATNLTYGDSTPAATEITFTSADASDTSGNNKKSFNDVTSISLSETAEEVTFTYTITSNETSDTIGVTMAATGFSDTDNVDVTYTVDGTAKTVTDTASSIGSITAGSSMTVVVKISITSLDSDVSLSGVEFTFNLDEVTA